LNLYKGVNHRLFIDIMSDNGLDLIIYLALTIGASAIGFFKSSKEKKAKNLPPVFHTSEEEDENSEGNVIIAQQPETFFPEEILSPVLPTDDAFAEKMKKEKEVSIEGFGRTDEERYAMLEKFQETRRGREKKTTILFKEENLSNEQPSDNGLADFEFDIRKAIISSEILNRKY